MRVPEVKGVLAKAVDWKLMFDINAPEFEQSKERPPRPLLDVSDWQGSFACGDNKHEQQVTVG